MKVTARSSGHLFRFDAIGWATLWLKRLEASLRKIPQRQHFSGGRPIPRATDPTRSIEESQFESELSVKRHDPFRCLIGKNHGTTMPGQPFGRSHLLVPTKRFLGVLRERDVVRWVRIHKVLSRQGNRREITAHDLPILESPPVWRKIMEVVDGFVLTERHVELTAEIEAAEAIKRGAVQIVEQRSRLRTLSTAIAHQFVESLTMRIEQRLIIFHAKHYFLLMAFGLAGLSTQHCALTSGL